MLKTLKISLVGLSLLIFQSFKIKTNNNIIGTYGVSINDPSGIQLVINEDQTFSYKDFSNPKKTINTTGTWKTSKGIVILTSTNFTGTFHNKWKFTEDGDIAKSRKGITYYTLCKAKIKR